MPRRREKSERRAVRLCKRQEEQWHRGRVASNIEYMKKEVLVVFQSDCESSHRRYKGQLDRKGGSPGQEERPRKRERLEPVKRDSLSDDLIGTWRLGHPHRIAITLHNAQKGFWSAKDALHIPSSL